MAFESSTDEKKKRIRTFSSASLKEDTTTASCLVTREATEEWDGQSGDGGDGMGCVGSVVSILRACMNWW